MRHSYLRNDGCALARNLEKSTEIGRGNRGGEREKEKKRETE